MRNVSMLFLVALVGLAACDSVSPEDASKPEVESAASRIVSSAELTSFLPSGDVGGGVLEAGLLFPPTKEGTSKLVRTADFVEYTINTTGLPTGAYTVWMVVINDPENCNTSPCTVDDVFLHTAEVDGSVFWTAGALVGASGHGYFSARVQNGYFPTDADQIAWPGSGLQDPLGAEFHLIVKYHGPASSDPEVLYEQTHTLLGSCYEGANALDLGDPFGIHCFDPQVVIHTP
jgi:hypothetical protein